MLWRLYLSCATPDTKHWWLDWLTAATVEGLPRQATGRTTRLGPRGIKDPVITPGPGGWVMWLCCHPLTEPGHEDRMTTRRLTSPDGLAGRTAARCSPVGPGEWDERGARVTTVLMADPLTVLYDGRADAASNWHETTGAGPLGRHPPRPLRRRAGDVALLRRRLAATPPRSRCPTAGPASTSRPPAPTARTTW